MNDLKWADVAHMYSRSGLVVEIDHPNMTERPCIRKSPIGEDLTRYTDGTHGQGWTVTPHLRHLEDMTPSEILECIMLSWPAQTKWTVKSYETTPEHDIFGHAFRYKIDFNENPPSSCSGFLSFIHLCPKQFHWCYKHGFDMNGLIEAGEAIRKPKD